MQRYTEDFESLLATPVHLESLANKLTWHQQRRPPAAGGFSFLHHVWHLADLEVEGYGARIARILVETEPQLPDFDGERIAEERRYGDLELGAGLARFHRARQENLSRVRAAPPESWLRAGHQEGVGRLTLRDVLQRMVDHDRSHLAEISALLHSVPC